MPLALSSHVKAASPSRLMIAGAALVGAGLFALNAPIPVGSLVQTHNVRLVVVGGDGPELDWAAVLAETNTNLAALHVDAVKGSADLSTALGYVSENISTRISDALSGFNDGIHQALFGGWYGGDDGYVFGLFGGEPVLGGPDAIPPTGSLLGSLAGDFQAGNTEQAYSDLNAFELELTDHTLQPLLSPFVDETDDSGNTTFGIPAELSQIQTNLLHTFANYDELKDGLKALLSPEITAQFALTKDLDAIAADFAGGNSTQGLSDLNNLSSDVFGAFVNGYDVGENPIDHTQQIFAGLLGDTSLAQHLVLTWPEQIVAALGALGEAPAGAGEAVGSSVHDLFSGLLSF